MRPFRKRKRRPRKTKREGNKYTTRRRSLSHGLLPFPLERDEVSTTVTATMDQANQPWQRFFARHAPPPPKANAGFLPSRRGQAGPSASSSGSSGGQLSTATMMSSPRRAMSARNLRGSREKDAALNVKGAASPMPSLSNRAVKSEAEYEECRRRLRRLVLIEGVPTDDVSRIHSCFLGHHREEVAHPRSKSSECPAEIYRRGLSCGRFCSTFAASIRPASCHWWQGDPRLCMTRSPTMHSGRWPPMPASRKK